jgi:hypothetical protein
MPLIVLDAMRGEQRDGLLLEGHALVPRFLVEPGHRAGDMLSAPAPEGRRHKAPDAIRGEAPAALPTAGNDPPRVRIERTAGTLPRIALRSIRGFIPPPLRG